MIDLEKFCSTDELGMLRGIARPWSRGEHTYATNGHIIIRVPRIVEIGENDNAPDANRLCWDKPSGAPVEIPELPAPEINDCIWCTGDDPEYLREDCEECNQTGQIRQTIPVVVGKMIYSDEYLGLIKDLPGVKFYPVFHDFAVNDRSVKPAYFSFDNGEGLLMPRRP